MDIFIYNASFQLVAVVDYYETFIWTERYSDYGDFELYLPVDSDTVQYFKVNYYIEIRESNRTMIIEDIQIDTDVDSGPTLKISGRSLESILDRRIIWKQTTISNATVDATIKQLLAENILGTLEDGRGIDCLEYLDPDVSDGIKQYTIPQIQFTGDNLFDAVKGICDAFQIGFEIIAGHPEEEDDGRIHFRFKLFTGVNRSYTNDDGTDQFINPHVAFSPNFDNLLNSSYLESNKISKTIALVAGSGEGSDRVMVKVSASDDYGEGLSRRELFVDARDLTKDVKSEDGSTRQLTDDEYNETLMERGREKLTEYPVIESFEGGVEPDTKYKYGLRDEIKSGKADYAIGDIVQVENEYGMRLRCRVIEFIRSKDATGSAEYPTFTKI